jgi:hypothetical protein
MGSVPACSPYRGASSAPTPSGAGAPEGARRREWRSGGSAHRQAANTDHGEVRERVREHRESKADEMHARGKEEGEWRVGVHGAALSDELGRNSGEQLQRLGALPLRAEASMGCVKGRRCSEEDGGSGGELWRPKRQTPARRGAVVVEGSRSAALLLWGSERSGGVSGADW